MSGEIKKICKNCDNLQYGFGESSMNYGPRCFEKDCGVDEDDTCDMFEVSSYEKVKKLQEQNKILIEALEKISTDTVEVGFYVEPTWSAQIAREALAKLNDKQGE